MQIGLMVKIIVYELEVMRSNHILCNFNFYLFYMNYMNENFFRESAMWQRSLFRNAFYDIYIDFENHNEKKKISK